VRATEQEAPVSADPYAILGVKREASQDEIRSAYRGLAKKLHPDLNPGDKAAEEKFKEVASAYDLLGDPDKRARLDRGEIDASGAERPRERYYRDFHKGDDRENPYHTSGGFADFMENEDILSEILGRGEGRTPFLEQGEQLRVGLRDCLERRAVAGQSRLVAGVSGRPVGPCACGGRRDGTGAGQFSNGDIGRATQIGMRGTSGFSPTVYDGEALDQPASRPIWRVV
jgi:hypothetical protein